MSNGECRKNDEWLNTEWRRTFGDLDFGFLLLFVIRVSDLESFALRASTPALTSPP